MERHPAAQELQPQTFVTMQQPEIHSTGNLPPPLGLYNGPYDFWPSGSPLSHIFGTNAIWQPTPIQFTIMTPIDSDGQPIAPHEEQSLEAELEAIQSGAGNAEATESVPVPSRGSSTSPIPSSHPIPTREYPRAATIPGMTPGRTRCDACYENHCRCDHGSDGLTDDELAARPHKKEPRTRKKGRAKKSKGGKPGGIRKGRSEA